MIENDDLTVRFENVGARAIGKTEISLLHDNVSATRTLETGSPLSIERQTTGAQSDRYIVSTPIAQNGTLLLHATGSFEGIWVITDSGETISYYVARPSTGRCYMSLVPISVDVDETFADQEKPFDTGSQTPARPNGISAASGGTSVPSDGKLNN